MSNWSRKNQANVILCNTLLHQISMTKEIVIGWESSIAVHTKTMKMHCADILLSLIFKVR